MVIETAVDRDLEHGTYADMLDRLNGYDDPAVHVRTIDGHLGDDTLVSDLDGSISYVDLTYAENPDSTIVITAGRHSPEYGGAEATGSSGGGSATPTGTPAMTPTWPMARPPPTRGSWTTSTRAPWWP